MADLSAEQELALRTRELDQDALSASKELHLKERELKGKKWDRLIQLTIPFTVAVLGLIAGIYTQRLTGELTLRSQQQASAEAAARLELANKEFCQRILADHLSRYKETGRERAALELTTVAQAIADNQPCSEILREVAQGLYAQSSAPASAPAQPTSPPCEKVASLKALGWSSGHKTNFCKARGFDDVYNPYGVYSAGGFCFKGPSNVCIPEIMRGRTQ